MMARVWYFLLNHTEQAQLVTLPTGSFTSLLDGKNVSGQVAVDAVRRSSFVGASIKTDKVCPDAKHQDTPYQFLYLIKPFPISYSIIPNKLLNDSASVG